MRLADPSGDIAAVPVTFEVGRHRVVLCRSSKRWTVAVDGMALEATFSSQVEGWEAGVREADALDRRTGT
jgi:hypothetical protein